MGEKLTKEEFQCLDARGLQEYVERHCSELEARLYDEASELAAALPGKTPQEVAEALEAMIVAVEARARRRELAKFGVLTKGETQ